MPFESSGASLIICRLHFRQCVKDDEESEDGKEKHGGKFSELCQSQEDARCESVFEARILEEAYEEVKGKENKHCDAEVGRHIVVVGDDIGIGSIERDRKESGKRPAELSGPDEDPEAEEDGEEDDRQARPEEDFVGIIAGDILLGAIDEHIADGPLFVDTGAPFAGLEREGRLKSEERESCEILEQRRVFGIEAHIAMTDITISRRDVGFFIKDSGFLAGYQE